MRLSRFVYGKQPEIKLRNYGIDNSDAFSALIQTYIVKVKSDIASILKDERGMSENKAGDFTDQMFNMGWKRTKDIVNDISDYYRKGNTSMQTAEKIVDKYYKIAVINSQNPIYSEPEETEVHESIGVRTDDPKYILKSKNTTRKVFKIFIDKLSEIGVRFKLNTYYIKGIDNSLNKSKSILHMKSTMVDSNDVIFEFKYSKVLSFFLKKLGNKKEISFFININNLNMMQYGYIMDGNEYELGYYKYANSDLSYIDSIVDKTNSNIDFKLLSKKFRFESTLIYRIRNILDIYLKTNEDINYYATIIRNKLNIIVDCDDSDVLNTAYLNRIIDTHLGSYQERVKIEKDRLSGEDAKDIYYITIE